MIENWFVHQRPIEYDYECRCTEYGYDEGRCIHARTSYWTSLSWPCCSRPSTEQCLERRAGLWPSLWFHDRFLAISLLLPLFLEQPV